MKHEGITKEIIGAAMAVLNELKPGLDERLYENALVGELIARGKTVEQQREYPVHYRNHFIGKLVPDLIVAGSVIADPKVVTTFNETHAAQMLGYLNNYRVGSGASAELQRSHPHVETRGERGKREPRISRMTRIKPPLHCSSDPR